MKKFKAILKDKQGLSVTIQMLIGFIFIALLFSMFLGISAQTHKISVLDRFADEMAIAVSTQGKCKGEIISKRYEQLENSTGLSPKISYSTNFYDDSNKTVQYGDSITVELTLETKFIGWGNFYLPMTLKNNATRQSMQYWK